MILDPVGAAYFKQNLQCLATEGVLILIGLMGGYTVANIRLRMTLQRVGIEDNRLRFHPPDTESKGSELVPPALDP